MTENVENVIIYGEQYAVVYFHGAENPYPFKLKNIHLITPGEMKKTPVYLHFLDVLKARQQNAKSEVDACVAENMQRQMDALTEAADTALNGYCSGHCETRPPVKNLIFPFGVNESQLAAVERAFSSQTSIIEGPPGTGKTQTILNILANVLLRGQTVAVLSNNNGAVANIYEKLEKSGLGYQVARLGNQENRNLFFDNLPTAPSEEQRPAPNMAEIQEKLAALKQHLHTTRYEAMLQMQLDELDVEQSKLQKWRQEQKLPVPADLDGYQLTSYATAQLLAYVFYLEHRPISLRDRFELMRHFRIFRTRPFAKAADREIFFHDLQSHFYKEAIREKKDALRVYKELLQQGKFTALLQALTEGSMRHLKHHILQRKLPEKSFSAENYKNDFEDFMRRFPILCSSTHSVVNSVAAGAVLDYVIIDEASQQDILPGILGLGCAKNLVVVGDTRQLTHIPVNTGLQPPSRFYDCEQYSLLDSCIGLFKDKAPRTLLREHYRCHPRIIQFCNQQFYDSELVPMTRDNGEDALQLIVTAKGNHTRADMNNPQSQQNLRELDSILSVLEAQSEPIGFTEDGRGFIAPFRAQIRLSETCLPADFIKDTLHKFQGRECDEIVFSTVLDKKQSSQRQLEFVDDPRMINVAVSRAKKRFTLVTGSDVFTANKGPLAGLISYMEYYAHDENIIRAPVVSSFDLLYSEFEPQLHKLRVRLNPMSSRFKSEQIVECLLREAISRLPRRNFILRMQIKLRQVVSNKVPDLDQRELDFLANGSTCDFVISQRAGKKILGVIEVDGGTHNGGQQQANDARKNSILTKAGIPLLRLRTVEARVEEKIDSFLAQLLNCN